MPGRLSRFLHLERPRAAGAEPAAGEGGEAGRFDAVEQAAPGPGPQAATGARLERFEPARPVEPSLELREAGAAARPFTRCERCGMDHGRFALECTHCGARLDTPGQLAFNERLWAERQAEAAREAAAGAALRAEQERAREEEARARRAAAEGMAREVGDRERRRLGGAGAGDWTPLGLVILRLMPDARWQVAAIGVGAVAVLGLVLGGLAGRAPGIAALGLVLGVVLVVPRGGIRRRW